MLYFIMAATVLLGLALPLSIYWLYNAIREKSFGLIISAGLLFILHLGLFVYFALVSYAVMHISVQLMLTEP